ncbi:serine/threonine-protein kinase [Glycomyces paridis]|uniref:Serine/threonine protein kinase n=1 Tax=Glycomyces paridis TaxID=2126555 RepID=A0A4S8PB96_9ACTN|nr:serine/threonine-protein kinase [Glycomyces paridis]THV26422.1 serine/threonine protein kinase [Glycomyces paridis]
MFALTANDPRQIGPYRVVASLGEGGMGHVYLTGSPDGRWLAVKRVLPHLAHDAGFRSRFALEVETARRVASPHTVRLVDADTGAEQPWLASEFIPGPTLVQHVEAHGPLAEAHVRRLGVDLAAALTAIHGAGLVHRDLKPSNVILTSTGSKLLDFGISRAIDYSTSVALTQTGGVVGSPGYMSPEQAQSNPLTERSDIFSLGCLLAMAATGRVPFEGPSIPQVLFKVVYEEPDLSSVPEALRGPIGACLAKDPADRPTLTELTEILSGTGEVASEAPEPVVSFIEHQRQQAAAFTGPAPTMVDQGPTYVFPPVPVRSKPRLSRPVIAVLAAVAALLVIVPLWIVLSSGDDPPPSGDGDFADSGSDGDESSASESSLSIPSSAELCELLDPESFATALGTAWEFEDIQEDDDACRATVRDSESIAYSSLSIWVVGTTADSWAFCPFTDCDYDYNGVLVGSESTERPWEMGGVVETGPRMEMIWYQEGLSGTVSATTMGADDEAASDLPDLLHELGVALYDLAEAA